MAAGQAIVIVGTAGKFFGAPYGNRTRVSALRGPRPRPLDEGSFKGQGLRNSLDSAARASAPALAAALPRPATPVAGREQHARKTRRPRQRRRQSGAARPLRRHHLPDRHRRRRHAGAHPGGPRRPRSRPGRSSRPITASRCAPRATVWEKFWQPLPPLGFTDIFALVKTETDARRRRPASVHGEPALLQGRDRRAAQAPRQAGRAMSPRLRTDHRPLSATRSARRAAPALCRGGGPGHSPALPAHRRLRRAAVSRADERRAHHRKFPRHRLRHALARQVLAAGRLAGRASTSSPRATTCA